MLTNRKIDSEPWSKKREGRGSGGVGWTGGWFVIEAYGKQTASFGSNPKRKYFSY